MKLIGKYKNGNYICSIYDNGTKIRENDLDFFDAAFPESMDIKITNRCNMGCVFCFKDDTKVKTKYGDINICNVAVGDIVSSYNIEKNTIENMPVKKLYKRHYSGSMIKIEIDNGKVLVCTPNHKIYTKRGYIRADEVTTEEEIMNIE